MEEAIQTAAEELGYSNLRVKQKEAIMHYLQGKDVFISLPTGSGKSLCYYILPIVFDILRNNSDPKCIVIVVSPLVALMKDQVTSLKSKGVKGSSSFGNFGIPALVH